MNPNGLAAPSTGATCLLPMTSVVVIPSPSGCLNSKGTATRFKVGMRVPTRQEAIEKKSKISEVAMSVGWIRKASHRAMDTVVCGPVDREQILIYLQCITSVHTKVYVLKI